MRLSLADLRKAFADVPGGENVFPYWDNGALYVTLNGKTLRFGEIATLDQIKRAFEAPRTKSMSISGYEPGSIKAKLEALKVAGKNRRDAALSKLDDAGKKHEAVSTEIEAIAGQIEKEADDALQEFAQFTNGNSA